MNNIFIIAEAGVNHNGSVNTAQKLIESAKAAGADAVKFQTFRAASLVSKEARKADYQVKTTGSSSQFEMLKKLELSHENHFKLKEYCKTAGIEFLSTPFDSESLNFLVSELGIQKIKIPSGEITNGPFLWEIGQTGIPAILSTGMSTIEEIENAIAVLALSYSGKSLTGSSFEQGKRVLQAGVLQELLYEKLTLLHCTTEYPAPLEDVNLKAMTLLKERFGLKVGYSDHTDGIAVSIGAAALGAQVIEKHFTLDKNAEGPDHKASLEPADLKQMIHSIRMVESALGLSVKTVTASEKKNLTPARKSLVAKTPIRAGEPFTELNLAAKRPGDGLNPMEFWKLLGTKAPRDFSLDEKIQL